MDEQHEPVWLTYREAAKRVGRSIRAINRWRRAGHLTMRWEERDGRRVRVVEQEALLACFRERLQSNPAWQWKMRTEAAKRAEQNAQDDHHARRSDTPIAQ